MSPAVSPFDVRRALIDAAHSELIERGRGAVSLRAVARRAGVSHAAPKHHFGDRAGLLTAVAAEGFQALADALDGIEDDDPRQALSALGRVYLEFARAHPALFDVMFRPAELHPNDEKLVDGQRRAIGALNSVAGGGHSAGQGSLAPLTLISWAVAHGLSVLGGDGALAGVASIADPSELAASLIELYSTHIDREALGQF